MSLSVAEITSTGNIDSLAQLCKAAGDPLRLEILCALRRDAYGVLELCHVFGVRQPAMSHHLKVLAEAGLVRRRREGTSIFYHRAHDHAVAPLEQVARAIYAAADSGRLGSAVQQRIGQIRAERAASSREFFAANAAKFRAQQELIAPRAQYEQAIGQLLESVLPEKPELALELGPGEGWLLPLLARQYRRVVAFDNSPAMLEQAREHCHSLQLDNVELVLGDHEQARARCSDVDLAVINMVLHHTPSPAEVMHDIAATLAPGAILLLTDLCAHDQSWARSACGDLWLGFAADDLGQWARDSGLREGESVYLALRNGFRVQLLVFYKSS